jgi:hypothetical protein
MLVLEGEQPSLVVPTAALFGLMPLEYKNSGKVKKVYVE